MSSTHLLAAGIVLLLASLAAFSWWLNRQLGRLYEKRDEDTTLTEWLKTMQSTLTETNRNVTETLQRQFRSQQAQLKSTAAEFAKMQREMGQFAEIGRAMRQLQDFLQSPKLRGNIGEEILTDLLRQMLPTQSFHLQYEFRGGARVDACIETELGKLPVDAKFPMSAWRRMAEAETGKDKETARKQLVKDVKKHIDAIAEKYILPEEGTMDLALMYIPSEPVFYEITHLTEILDYARRKRVVPVSPTTFYAYLQAVLSSFQQRRLMVHSREIMARLQGLAHEYAKTEDGLRILGRHIQNAYNSFASLSSGFTLLGQKLSSVQKLDSGEEVEADEAGGESRGRIST
jgi:DNA recombination protein RmuC